MFEVYLSAALRTPFADLWGLPCTEHLPVTVLGIGDDYADENVLLHVRLADGDQQENQARKKRQCRAEAQHYDRAVNWLRFYRAAGQAHSRIVVDEAMPKATSGREV